ncbi:MAG TPA: PadR family transcriptional regulator [Polyangiaceae bacterium]|nr:PadR family transcriptional regulator [Polyangiaceae bacterium]
MSLRQAILGFLELEPTTGYTLGQRFSGSVGSFWTATQSQIYRELHQLERDGLAQVEVVPQAGKPPRKVYSLTEPGRAELARLLEAASEPLVLRDPFLLGFVFSADVPPERLDALLEQHGAELAARQQEYRARLGSPQIFSLARSEREAALWRLSLENGLGWCEAQLAWVARARSELAALPNTRRKAATEKRKPTKHRN